MKVVRDIAQENIDLIAKLEHAANLHRTTGQKVADYFAAMVGSWTFIIIQSVLLTVWVLVNLFSAHRWDVYPFILLNLMLSFQAAYASPIIMMSQNRQARIAERRNQLDLQINLLAERESTEILKLLRQLCQKSGVEMTAHSAPGLEEQTDPQRILERIESTTNATLEIVAKESETR